MLDQFILIFYLLSTLAIGFYASRKVKSFSEFALSGRNYGAFVIFATLSASFIGGGFSSGNASKVFLFGIGNIICLWGFSIKEILVAKFVIPKMTRFRDAISVGDMIGQAYGNTARIITGVFSIFLCAGIMGAQVGAMGDVFHVFTGMNEFSGILIGCGIAIIYSTFGGMRAVIATDVVQFIILSIGLTLVMLLGIQQVGGVESLFTDLPKDHLSVIPAHMNFMSFLSLFLILLLGETLVPPYVQRLLIGRNLRETAKGTLWSGLFSIPFFAITGIIGLIAWKLDASMDATLALPNVVKMVLPVGLRGIVIAGVISIVMSSADSFLNGASVAFTNDIYKSIKGKSSMKTDLLCARTVNLATGLLAILFAICIPNILDILIFAYTFWAPVILFPLIAAIFGFGSGRNCFLISASSGLVGAIVWKYALGDPFSLDGLLFGIICNACAFGAVNTLQSKKTS